MNKIKYFANYIVGDTLNLSRQSLTDADMLDIVHFLYEFPQIKKLDLSLNNIGDQGIGDFAERNLTVIEANFSGNNISDHGIAIFAYKNQTILEMNFSYNRISEKGINNYALINNVCDHTRFSSMQYH